MGIAMAVQACSSEGGHSGHNNEIAAMDSIFAALPTSLGPVSDFENILSQEEQKQLGTHIHQIGESSPFEVVIATTDSITPFEDIMSYATALGNKWNVGDAQDNNGLVIVVSSGLGQAAIATGNGIEKIFTDSITKSIIDLRMVPHFMRGNFYAGLDRALTEIDRIAAGLKEDSVKD